MQNECEQRLRGEEVKLWKLRARKHPWGDIPRGGSTLGRNKHQRRGCGFALMKRWKVLACVESGRGASARSFNLQEKVKKQLEALIVRWKSPPP